MQTLCNLRACIHFCSLSLCSDTKTASGPNSFNKGKHGFSDPRSWERLQQNSPAIKDSGDVGKKPEES